MAFTHGKDSAFKLDNTAAALQDISQYVDSVDGLPNEVEMGETTAFGKESKTYIPGLADGQVEIGGPWDAALDAIMGNTTQWKAATRSYEYGPEGSTSGKTKYSGECWIQNYTVSAPVGEVVKWSATLQLNDDVTRGTFA